MNNYFVILTIAALIALAVVVWTACVWGVSYAAVTLLGLMLVGRLIHSWAWRVLNRATSTVDYR